MALPVLAAIGTRVAAMAPSALATFAGRLGVRPTVAAVVNYAKAHPVLFASNVASAAIAGDQVASALLADDKVAPFVAENAPEPVRHEVDPIKSVDVSAMDRYRDELDVISRAAAMIGSLDRLIVLRKALAMPDEYFELYRSVRSFRLN